MQMVTILETRDSFAAKLAKAALEDAGIEYMTSEENHYFPPGFFGASGIGETPLWNRSCFIQVAPEREKGARALLECLESPEALQDDGA